MRYRHTQIGWLMLVFLAIPAAVLAVMAFVTPGETIHVLFAIVAGVLVVLVLLFGTLTVTVADRRLVASFGVGLIRWRYDLEPFADVRTVRNRWYYGWGIRFIPKGILLNVSGLDAVELRRLEGRVVRIGTDEPHKLKRALREALNDIHREHADWKPIEEDA